MLIRRIHLIMRVHRTDAFTVQFIEPLDELGDARGINLCRRDWDDMGSPDTITVTIEPGDTLNRDKD